MSYLRTRVLPTRGCFDGLDNLGASLRLEVDLTVKPVQQALRRAPKALRTPLKEYLDDLEDSGVIEKVERPTEWVTVTFTFAWT